MSCPDAYGLPNASTSVLELPKQRRASYAHLSIVCGFLKVRRCTAAGVTRCSSARAGTFGESILLYKWPGKLCPEGGPCGRLNMEAARRANSRMLTQNSTFAVNQAMLTACQVCYLVQLLASCMLSLIRSCLCSSRAASLQKSS